MTLTRIRMEWGDRQKDREGELNFQLFQERARMGGRTKKKKISERLERRMYVPVDK